MDKMVSDDFLAYINELLIEVESDIYRVQMKISELVFELLTRYDNSIEIQCYLITESIVGSETFICNEIFWNDEESVPYCSIENKEDVRWDSLTFPQQFEVLQSMHHAAVSNSFLKDDNSQELH